ncbi:MAG: hypothetical protein AAGA20_07925 [Planctomycetota bacterium]
MFAPLLCVAAFAPVLPSQETNEKDPTDAAFDHFRDRYELYSTIGDLDRDEFRSLISLSVADSDFNDDDAPHLIGLEALERLDLSGAKITDRALESIGRLPIGLRALDVSDTSITDEGLVWLAFLESLEALDVSGTSVTDTAVVQMPRFKGSLMSLTLGSGVSDEGLLAVPELTSLEHLSVSVDGISSEGAAAIAGSASLRRLELRGEKVSLGILREIAAMDGLESLALSGFSGLKDRHLEPLERMPSLRFLDVSGTGISDEGLVVIAAIPQISGLVLSDTAVTDAGMKHLGDMVWHEEGAEVSLRTATELTHIELARTAITDRGLDHLNALPIARLDVSETQITNAAKKTLDRWKLESIALRGTSKLTDLSFVVGQPELLTLDVSQKQGINSQVRHLDEHPSLRVLDLSYTDLQDAATMPLTRLRRLRELNVAGTAVSLENLAILAELGKLELVNVRDTNILVHGEERRELLPGVKVSRSESFPDFAR